MASSVNDFLNPSLVLQHTGWYWYASARCSVRRKETFQAALAAEEQAEEVSFSINCLARADG